MTIHQQRTHPQFVEGCFGCRVSSVQVGPAATPSRQRDPRQYAFQQRFAEEWTSGDRDAYRRLRANGVQPPTIRGSARLEQLAETRYEIEAGEIARDPAKLKEALAIADSGGFDPLRPAIRERGPDDTGL